MLRVEYTFSPIFTYKTDDPLKRPQAEAMQTTVERFLPPTAIF